jgi:rhodanese-related sulfurtransferase
LDDRTHSITPDDLYGRLGTQNAPLLIDVRRVKAFDEDAARIVGAIRREPDTIQEWATALPPSRPVVTYCVHGHEVSQGAAAALRAKGLDARYLQGGVSAWREQQRPTRLKRGPEETAWVTREHPKIDRIACPWLVSRFIEPEATFVYVPSSQVAATAERIGGMPYDIEGATFGHVGDQCSFDAIIHLYDIHDAALDRLANIVRGADTSSPQLTPQCEGLLAISYGLSANFPDDHAMLRHGLVIYDALYTWCRMQTKSRA